MSLNPSGVYYQVLKVHYFVRSSLSISLGQIARVIIDVNYASGIDQTLISAPVRTLATALSNVVEGHLVSNLPTTPSVPLITSEAFKVRLDTAQE